MVECRYSPATARIPKMRVNTAAKPVCARAARWVPGSWTFPPDSTRPLMPATTSSGPAASSSQGVRIVLSLRNSLRISGNTGVSSVRGGRQVQERGLERAVRAADLAQRPREAQFTSADDHDLIGRPGDLAQRVAGHDHRPPLAGQVAQRAAEPGRAA